MATSKNRKESSLRSVALLRGVNVGGKNMLPMLELAGLFADAGAARVQTYIQSGNVLFESPTADVERIRKRVEQALERRFAHPIPLVLRSVDELALCAKHNPFLATGADSDRLHIGFLRDLPDAKQAAALDPKRSPPDQFALRGREVYLHFPDRSIAKTKLTNAYFDRVLDTVVTVRNWRTLLKLIELGRA